MREKTLRQGYFKFSNKSTLKVVNEYRGKYERISGILEANPEILGLAHKDFSRGLTSSDGGRGGYASEQLLRAIVVMFLEGDSYRDTVIRIENSEYLRDFIGLGPKPTMDYTFLCKAYGVLTVGTWKRINEALDRYAKKEGKIEGDKVRVDTTVYETNVHYPTDSSLLWDSYRVLSRLMKRSRGEMLAHGLNHRFHVKKVKKLAGYISRNGGSKSTGKQRKVKSSYRQLIEMVRWINDIAARAAKKFETGGTIEAMVVASELRHYTPIVAGVIDQSERRVFNGEVVPSDEKVYSIFEEHTELIKRGKAGKPIEFGHKVLLAETGEKYIFHYEAYPKRREDKDLIDETLETHSQLFSSSPGIFAADKGFYESSEQLRELDKKIRTVSICKKGRRTLQEEQRESTEEFKAGQRFRAGIEGTISVLKRAFKLNRCLFRGFKNYATSLGCAVFCHNLVLLTRL